MFYRLALAWMGVAVLAVNGCACDSCGCSIGDPSRGGGSGITAGISDVRKPLSDLVITRKMRTPADSAEAAAVPGEVPLSNGNVPDFTQPSTPAPSGADGKLHRWLVDTTFEYRRFQQNRAENSYAIIQSGHDQHAYRFDYFVTEHIGYLVSADLAIGVTAGFRDLHKLDVDNLARLGQRETSTGATDLTFDAKYIFMHQTECFPLDLAVYAAVKTPFGETNNRRPTGELFETEDQPGSGSWNETLGLAASHGWEKWGASASVSYTKKGEGSQQFREGDITRMSVSASRLLSPTCYAWKLYGSMGLQGLIERHAIDHGEVDPDHGGKFMYVLPGIAAKPTDRIIVSLTAPIPVIQDENGTHQKQRWNVQLGVGLRF